MPDPIRTRRASHLLFLALTVVVSCREGQGCCGSGSRWEDSEPFFNGTTKELEATVVVPTLDTPLPQGKNVIWCASFAMAWEALADEVVGDPIQLDEGQEVADRLNAAEDFDADLPEGAVYTNAGSLTPELLSQINKDMARQFPNIEPNVEGAPGGLLAYAYLAAQVRFKRPYNDNDEPLVFRDSAGGETPVASFGLRQKDAGSFDRLRGQPEVIWSDHIRPAQEPGEPEFVIDLDQESEPVQIVLARVAAKETLSSTLDYIRDHEVSGDWGWAPKIVDTNDTLLVPNLDYRLSHDFRELEGRYLANPGYEDYWFQTARQDIAFRLDRSGATLKSEAPIYVTSAPAHYHFDKPFLVVMSKRGAERPFFVMWVENSELLVGFDVLTDG